MNFLNNPYNMQGCFFFQLQQVNIHSISNVKSKTSIALFTVYFLNFILAMTNWHQYCLFI